MVIELENLDEVKLQALEYVQANKLKVAHAYNKKVKAKPFG